MSKRYSFFLSLLFCAFLGAIAVWNLLTPDRTFSPNENRYLQQKPDLSVQTVFSGDFMAEYETYVTDQFAGRDSWIAIKAVSERLLGKQENNGVYFGTDRQTLFARFDEPDPAQVEQNLNFVSTFAQNVGVPVYFSLIPGKDAVWADRLPAHAPNGNQWAILDQAEAACTSAQWLDVSQALTAHAQDADPSIFYRLDHHWTSYGAYWGYTALMEGMGLEAKALSDFDPTVASDSFCGTTYSSSGVRWMEPDVIEFYVPQGAASVTNYFDQNPTEGQLYDLSKLDEKDKYSAFLGGNKPLTIIKSNVAAPDAPKLLLVRDSFSDTLAPFLCYNFSEIHLVDPRYYRVSLPQYIQENDIDQVLVLYSVANFVSEKNLFVLGM